MVLGVKMMDNQAFQLLMEKLKTQDERFDSVEKKLDDILAWKLKLTGATLIISAIVGVVMQIVIRGISG